jgi:prevent-host-death family protein
LAKLLGYLSGMVQRRVQIGEFRNRVSSYISRAERGETIAILRRNREVALLQPASRDRGANEKLVGCLKGTARVVGDITKTIIPEAKWFKGS